jgi:hypothetical protein
MRNLRRGAQLTHVGAKNCAPTAAAFLLRRRSVLCSPFSFLISVAPGSEYSSKKLIFEELNPQIL